MAPWHHGMLVWTTLKVHGVQTGAVVVMQQGPRPMPKTTVYIQAGNQTKFAVAATFTRHPQI